MSANIRWKQIADALQSEIESGHLVPGERLPSEIALAKQWTVCRMTAHRAMDELQRQGLVVRKRRSGTVVAGVRSQRQAVQDITVAVLAFSTDDFPSASYLRGVRDGLPDDFDVLLCDTGEAPVREAKFLRRLQRRVDGIIIMPTCAPENTPLLRRIAQSGVPVVCIDRTPAGLEVPALVTDNYGSTLAALRVLTAKGHRRIAHFTDRRNGVAPVEERCQAFLEALREVGEPEPEHWVRKFTSFATATREQYHEQMYLDVHDALFTLLHSPEPPTAVFCLQDVYLFSVLKAAADMGVRVPEDLEVIAFSDFPPPMHPISGRAHRLVQQAYELGYKAGNGLSLYLQGGPEEIMETLSTRVPAKHVTVSD
jgi:GntR family transcriptional regulator of arabinose operon